MRLAIIIVVAASVVFQFIAAFLAVRLIAITRKRAAWLLVATAVSLMTVRRLESLIPMLSGAPVGMPDALFDVIGLIISCFMLAGIYLIGPVFSSLARSEAELRGMNERLSAVSKEQRDLIDRLHEALASIKTLKGLLPICASCKKVRDDKGYWNQIEEYVRDRSDAEFSHGLCPDCARKLYPQYIQSDKKT
jgi:hypothetical protein